MPNRVADKFRQVKSNLPESTEAERLVVQRVGQGLFRDALLDYWQGRCCVTGLAMPSLLRASHIKPWAKCVTDDERLDVFNGLLLAPNLDALFDGGWISFADDGALLTSSALPSDVCVLLGVSDGWHVPELKPAHLPYLAFHRLHELRRR
jgi:putative restriction endonuclease